MQQKTWKTSSRLRGGFWVALALMLSVVGCTTPETAANLTPVSTAEAFAAAPTTEPTPVPQDAPTPTAAPTATPAPTEITCVETTGRIEERTFESVLVGSTVRYRVYLPPCYDEFGVRYPTLYMLHGMTASPGQGMDDSMWDRMGLDEAASAGYLAGELPPMVIVMPNGEDAQHDFDTGAYGQVIVEELMPSVEANTCTWNERSARAIGGLSRGGYWAYSVAFLNPGLFAKVGAHSGFFYEGDFPGTNPYNLIAAAPGIEQLDMYLDYGADDTIVTGRVEDFAAQLEAQRGIEPLFTLYPEGGHTEDYWSARSPDYLAWYAADWPTDLNAYPPCE